MEKIRKAKNICLDPFTSASPGIRLIFMKTSKAKAKGVIESMSPAQEAALRHGEAPAVGTVLGDWEVISAEEADRFPAPGEPFPILLSYHTTRGDTVEFWYRKITA
jgi:hypothetical protein